MARRGFLSFLLIWAFVQRNSADKFSKEVEHHRRYEWDESCRNETYCTIPSKNYPMAKIKELLQTMIQLGNSINTDSEKTYGNRQGSIENQLCKPKPNRDPVHEIIDTNGKLRYVVQYNGVHMQIISLEKCTNPGKIDASDLEATKNISCREKRLEYNYMVLSESKTGFEWVYVAEGLPVSCYCYI